jgi:hypothetical protein
MAGVSLLAQGLCFYLSLMASARLESPEVSIPRLYALLARTGRQRVQPIQGLFPDLRAIHYETRRPTVAVACY